MLTRIAFKTASPHFTSISPSTSPSTFYEREILAAVGQGMSKKKRKKRRKEEKEDEDQDQNEE